MSGLWKLTRWPPGFQPYFQYTRSTPNAAQSEKVSEVNHELGGRDPRMAHVVAEMLCLGRIPVC